MRLRDQVALTLPSLMLRLVLGITFLWAGTGKLVGTAVVTGDDAARLANIGVMPVAHVEPAPSAQTTDQEPDAAPKPIETPKEGVDDPEPTEETSPVDEPPSDELIEKANDIIEKLTPPASDTPDEPTPSDENTTLDPVQYTGTQYAAADFPDPMEVKQVYTIALMISKAADPGLTDDSTPIQRIMPAMLDSKPWPKAMAWMAAITELTAGAFLILGLLTRFSALGTLSVMLMAMWMTQIGPAAMQDNNALLGFIPARADPWSPMSYIALFWQLALATMSLSVFFLGSGAIGIDRLLFKPARKDPYLHGDPKAGKGGKGAATPTSEPPRQDRTAFDRTPNPTP